MLTTAKWTIDDYHRIIASGILDQRRIELILGDIVDMASEGESHAYSSDEAGEYLTYLLGQRAKVRQAKPITIPQSSSEPEPDIAVRIWVSASSEPGYGKATGISRNRS